jgi:hypothetical protein
MGRRRKGNPEGKTDPAKVRPPEVPRLVIDEETLRRLKEAVMQQSSFLKELQSRQPEPKPMRLTDEQLDQLLAAIQDGEVEYGEKDCEVIGELICEVLEHRKAAKSKGGAKVMPQPFRIPDPFWDGPPMPVKTATEQRIEEERRIRERAMYESMMAARKSTPRQKGEPFWQADYASDTHTLFAPNGQKLYTVSGLDMMSMKNPQTEMGKIAEREMMKWREAQKGV